MIKHEEQLYEQLYQNSRLSDTQKTAIWRRVQSSARTENSGSVPQQWKWNLFRAVSAAACIAATLFSIHAIRVRLPIADPGSSGIESELEEIRSETTSLAEFAHETTAADTSDPSVRTTTLRNAEQPGSPDSSGDAAGSLPTVSGTASSGECTTQIAVTTTAAGTGSAQSQTTQTTRITQTAATQTELTQSTPAVTAATVSPPAADTFRMENVTCAAGETFTLRLSANTPLADNGILLDIDIEDEITDRTLPAYQSMTPVWLREACISYSWNPATMTLSLPRTQSTALSADTCLLTLTMQMPEDVPAGTVYNVYMSQYPLTDEGSGSLQDDSYIICTVTVQ